MKKTLTVHAASIAAHLLVCGVLLTACPVDAAAQTGRGTGRAAAPPKVRPAPAVAVAAVDVTMVTGKLVHHGMSNELFRIEELWIRVAEDTEFHRWLSTGIDRDIDIVLVGNAGQLADDKGTRLLIGKLIDQTSPNPTPNTVNVVGDLPTGNLPMVHTMFLRDEATKSIGAVTLETADGATALKFEKLIGENVTFAMKIR